MEEEDAVSNINFISCVQFIKQGVAKERPDKVNEGFKTIINYRIPDEFIPLADHPDKGGAGTGYQGDQERNVRNCKHESVPLFRVFRTSRQGDDDDDDDDDASSGQEDENEDEEMDTNENQRPQADTRADDDEFNLANYDNEGSIRVL